MTRLNIDTVKMMIRSAACAMLLIVASSTHAQRILTLQEAINITLKNSYEIQIARNTNEADIINNNIATAGGVPTVGATANNNRSLTSVNQKLSSGTDINRNNSGANALSGGISGSFLIFNGFRVYATKGRLAALEKLSEQQINAQIQNTIAAVAQTYYGIVRQDSYLKTIQQSIEVSRKRKEIADAKKSVGLANNADTYQAQIDLSASEQDYRQQQLILLQAKADLINLMNEKMDTSFIIRDTIIVDNNIRVDSIISAIKNNPELLSADQQVYVNEWLEKEVKSQRYPAVGVTGGYNYSRSQNGAGQLLLNQAYGPFIGLNLQVPIFNGGVIKRQQRVAAIETRNSKLVRENLLSNFESLAIKSWQTYQNTLQRLEAERENNRVAVALLDLVFQRFQLGVGTIVDVREAQRSYLDAGFRLVNLAYDAKIAEIELKRLGNKLEF